MNKPKPIQLTIFCKSHSMLYCMAMLISFPLLFFQAPHLLAQSHIPKTTRTDSSVKTMPIGPAFGKISGRVLDDTKQPLPSAVIQVLQGGILKGGAATDFDGNYTIAPLEIGYYDVMVIFGLDTFTVKNVLVSLDKTYTLNVTMKRNNEISYRVYRPYTRPLVEESSQPPNVYRSHGTITANITGLVLDETKQPLPSTVVRLFQDSVGKGGSATDFDGNYKLDGITPGCYDIMFTFFGYDTILVTKIVIKGGEHLTLNESMLPKKNSGLIIDMIRVYCPPMLDQNNPTKRTFNREEIDHIPH